MGAAGAPPLLLKEEVQHCSFEMSVLMDAAMRFRPWRRTAGLLSRGPSVPLPLDRRRLVMIARELLLLCLLGSCTAPGMANFAMAIAPWVPPSPALLWSTAPPGAPHLCPCRLASFAWATLVPGTRGASFASPREGISGYSGPRPPLGCFLFCRVAASRRDRVGGLLRGRYSGPRRRRGATVPCRPASFAPATLVLGLREPPSPPPVKGS